MSRDVSTLGWIDVKTGQSICLPKPAYVEDGAYRCLKGKFPNVRRDLHDHTRAFDPDSGRNFAWDKEKQAWIDVKTGECVCPKCEPKRTAQLAATIVTIGSKAKIALERRKSLK
jgi:hypothetical protein